VHVTLTDDADDQHFAAENAVKGTDTGGKSNHDKDAKQNNNIDINAKHHEDEKQEKDEVGKPKLDTDVILKNDSGVKSKHGKDMKQKNDDDATTNHNKDSKQKNDDGEKPKQVHEAMQKNDTCVKPNHEKKVTENTDGGVKANHNDHKKPKHATSVASSHDDCGTEQKTDGHFKANVYEVSKQHFDEWHY